MAGYHIRTASGIVPVLDWYLKILGPASSSISHSMTAATAAGGSKGYENGNAAIGQAAYGSLSPLADGGFELRGLTWAQGAANEPTIVYMGPPAAASTPVPADDDTTFSRIDITGVFFDSSGASVTRTLVRANADFTGSGANGTRQWQFRGTKAAQFISGNTYTAVMQRTAGAAPIITKVKEAYIRTASGIQKYWPGAFAPVTRTYDSGSGTETVPAGATSVTIKLWGAGAGGGLFTGPPGGGGGGGGYAERTLAVTGGQTFTYAVGAGGAGRPQANGLGSGTNGGNSNVISASPAFTQACNGATAGTQSAGGAGGTVSNTGGSVSTTGSAGSVPLGGNAAGGGAGGSNTGLPGTAPGGGGGGQVVSTGAGGAGANARAQFIYT